MKAEITFKFEGGTNEEQQAEVDAVYLFLLERGRLDLECERIY